MFRKSMLMAAVALIAVPAFASGQSQVSATATVGNFSQVTGAGDVDFGTLSRVTDNVIDAAGGAGAAERTVDFNHNIRVTFTNVPTELTAAGGLSLPVSLTCASQMGGVWSTPVGCEGAQLDLDVGTSLTTATLGFGGTITAAAVQNAAAATYTGTLDIVVTAR